MSAKFLHIVFNRPLNRAFDYAAPENHSLCADIIGARVLVPFGNTNAIGLIMGYAKQSDVAPDKIRPAIDILDPSPLLEQDHLDFLRWAADYYHHPLGEVVFAALPRRLRKHHKMLSLNTPHCRLIQPSSEIAMQRNASRQQAIVQALAAAEHQTLPLKTLQDQFGPVTAVLKRLEAKKIVDIHDTPPSSSEMHWRESGHQLNAEQTAAIDAIKGKFNQFQVFLLDGVTGSGKTEVYMQLTKSVLSEGKNVLLLVPEIALTPQLAQGFRERLGDCITILHSGLSDAEREISWRRAKLGLSRLIIGTRSLIFSPVAKLGLVIVDEEHDPSFKQHDGLRYSARDLAVIRAQRAHCPILLGSATPSLETLHNAARNRYQHLRLTRRAGLAQPPAMRVLDINDQPLQSGMASALLQGIQQTLAKHQQVLIFINRRGYAPVLTCHHCHWVSACHQCDAHQTVHRAANQLRCHHCGAQRHIPMTCPECGSPELHPLGQGTERIEDFLQAQFPDTPLFRIDRDTVTHKNRLHELLQRIHQSDAAILVGTQMLAKGHHFPKVTLVGILNADAGLFSTDFRAAERMAQLLLQIAGRAGRDKHPGQVMIQSRYPDHPLLRNLVEQGYADFAQAALAERQEAGYPPFSYQILIRADAKKAEQAEAFLDIAATWIKQHHHGVIDCWGPVPAPMARRVGRYRSHLLMQAKQRTLLHEAMRRVHLYLQSTRAKKTVRWSIDVDPYDAY